MKLIRCFVSDIDECKLDMHICHEHAVCENIKGNYTCVCKDGYNGDGFSCVGMSYVYFLQSKLKMQKTFNLLKQEFT